MTTFEGYQSMSCSGLDSMNTSPINSAPQDLHVLAPQDLRISPSSAFVKALHSSLPDLKQSSSKLPTLPYVVKKGSEEGGPKDLHPIIRKSRWKRLLECLKALQLMASTEDLHEAFMDRNEYGETPLHTAAWKAPPRLALMMLDLLPEKTRKEFLLSVDRDGNTPLHLACANVDNRVEFSVIKNLLLLAPEALEMRNNYGDSPLHLLVASEGFRRGSDFAVESAAEEAITSLVGLVPALATSQNESGATLLHVAIGNGAHERVLVKLLALAPGAAEIGDSMGMLPIHYVAAFGGTPWTFVGQLLWTFPESIVCVSHHADTPLHLLMTNANKYVKKDQFLDRSTTKLAELLVGSGDEDVSPLMIQNHENLSPLHCCALFDTPPQLTRVLMECPLANAASALTTQFGATALHLACASTNVSESIANVEYLATREACAIVDSNDRTPLMVAVQNGKASSRVIKALTKAFPEAVSQKSSPGFLPLHVALQSSKVKESVVKALIKADPESVEVVTMNGNTALHEACMYGASLSVVELLLEKNHDALYQINDKNETPLDRAEASSASDDVIALIEGTYVRKSVVRTVSDFSMQSFPVDDGLFEL